MSIKTFNIYAASEIKYLFIVALIFVFLPETVMADDSVKKDWYRVTVVKVKPALTQAFLDNFTPIVNSAQKADGNKYFYLQRAENKSPGSFIVSERWKSKKHHDDYGSTREFRDQFEKLLNLELFVVDPDSFDLKIISP